MICFRSFKKSGLPSDLKRFGRFCISGPALQLVILVRKDRLVDQVAVAVTVVTVVQVVPVHHEAVLQVDVHRDSGSLDVSET
jgi:hypothetical protein